MAVERMRRVTDPFGKRSYKLMCVMMARASGLKLTRFSAVGLREDEGGMFDSTAFEPSSGDPKSIPRVKPGAIVKISPGNRI